MYMSSKPNPLLCELHSHTTWSDGDLTVPELVDLYGRAGFDVLAVTDHTSQSAADIGPDSFPAYLEQVDSEALRAHRLYGMLVIPGLELTYEERDPAASGHAVAVGLRSFVGVEEGLEPALRVARARGAALIAAHPYLPDEAADSPRATATFAVDPDRWAPLVDRFELFNRHTMFPWVAETGLPGVATGDFHVPGHLATWKTLVPCAKDERAVVDYLRSRRPAYLVRLDDEPHELRRAA
jgi:predicted metal-dependent phosphoesterase TrpH